MSHYKQALKDVRVALRQLEDETPILKDEREFVDRLAWAAWHAQRGWYESR